MLAPSPNEPTSVRALGRFLTCRDGVAAVEFALVMPLLIVFMLAGTEFARFVTISGKVSDLASSLASLVAERSSSVTWDDLRFIQTATPVVFPEILKDAQRTNQIWSASISITISSVQFVPTVPGCTTGCTYTGFVAWSVGNPKRPCIIPQFPAPSSANPSPTTLPQDIFTNGSAIVVDIVYTYTPTFGESFISPLTLKRSAYSQPRYSSTILYKLTGSDPGNSACPGFPTAS